MSISVNPPPQQNLPAKLLDDPELRPFFLYQQEYLFKLWLRTGGGEDFISNIDNRVISIEAQGGSTHALFAKLQQEIGSGMFLTCDDTGFTCDSTEFTCDMDEA